MSERVDISGLSVDRDLYDLLEEISVGSGVEATAFWHSMAAIIDDLGVQNRSLLEKRDHLQEQIDAIDQAKKGSRLPVLSTNNRARYVIHKSILTEYLSTKALDGVQKQKLEKLTLENLVDDKPDLKDTITSFGAVKPDATLDKVKVIMEQSSLTQDVFVTRNGSVDGEVIGWITNVILDKHSRL